MLSPAIMKTHRVLILQYFDREWYFNVHLSLSPLMCKFITGFLVHQQNDPESGI